MRRSDLRRSTRLAFLVCVLAATAGCHGPAWTPPGDPGPVRSPDERQIRVLMAGWWRAAITRDSAYFQRVLAPDFVWRRSRHHEYDWSRARFLQYYTESFPCGPGTTYQVTLERYLLLGRHAIVSQSVTTWPLGAADGQNEVELSHVFEKRRGRWWLVEGRYVWYQLPSVAWTPPDSTLPPASADAPYNPAERPTRVDAACRPEWLPSARPAEEVGSG